MKEKLKNLTKVAALALFAIAMVLNLQANLGDEMSMKSAFGTDAGDPEGTGAGTKIKDVQTAQKLVVTEITGGAAIQAGLSVGSILGADASLEIKGAVKAVTKDCYKIDCFTGGSVFCNPSSGWTQCASGGCPTAQTTGAGDTGTGT